MTCRFYSEERYRIRGGSNIVPCCSAGDGHEAGCSGYRDGCDKELTLCPFGVPQGPETYCKQSHEVQECRGDSDFCQLPDEVQKKIDWRPQ